MNAFVTLFALFGAAAAYPSAPAPAPYHAPAPAPYHAPAPAPYHAPAHPVEYAPAPFAFSYGVADDYSKANFGANEARDGYKTSGTYRVALPDGRTQIVTYGTADAYSGNVAQVTYEGVASYGPAPKPIHKPVHAAPVYHAAPVHAAPVYHAAPVPVAPVYHAAPAPLPAYHA